MLLKSRDFGRCRRTLRKVRTNNSFSFLSIRFGELFCFVLLLFVQDVTFFVAVVVVAAAVVVVWLRV